MSFLGPSRDTFDIYQDNSGEYRWRRQARNGKIVAESGEGYKERRAAEKAVVREKGVDMWLAALIVGFILGLLLCFALGSWFLHDDEVVVPAPTPSVSPDTGGIPVPKFTLPPTPLPDAPQPVEDEPQPGEPEPHGSEPEPAPDPAPPK